METTLNYEIIYPPRPKAPSRRWDPRAPMYASQDGRAASLSSQECVFLVNGSNAPHVMTMQVLQAMDMCREFRTLDDHAARIASTLPGLSGKHDDVKRVVENLVQRQLLLSDEDFIARFRDASERPSAPMRGVFIRACDRPERLRDLLVSLVEYEKRHRAGRRYVLMDDSAQATNIDEHRSLLRDFTRETGCQAKHIGQSEVVKLVQTLAKAMPGAGDAAGAALLRDAHPQAGRFGGGRSRNLGTLLSAGARLILLDDDLRLPLLRPDFARDGFDPNPDASHKARFYEDMQQALSTGEETDGDPFELHLQACSGSLGTCIDKHYGLNRDSLRGLSLSRLDLLRPDARIVTTHHGSYGSTRSESTLWLYQLTDAISREEFWQDRASYDRNVDAHYMLYASDRARVLEVPGFTPFALDNSTLLPCTNPVGRAEDSLGSALTRYCQPDAVALELPVAVGHVQETLRQRFPITQSAKPPRVNDFLREFVRRQIGQFKAEDPGQRLSFMSHIMRDLSGASVRERVEHLREYRRYVHADIVDRLQRQLETNAEAPIYWQADVRGIVQANAKALLESESAPRLAEWHEDIDVDGCAQALRDELDSMARVCEHWPAIWQYAAEQGEKLLNAF